MEVTPKQLKNLLSDTIEAGLVPMVTGSPGVGKSDTMKQLANKYNLELVDIRLSQMEPSDLLGFPSLEGEKAIFKPVKLFPLQSDPLPNGKAGWLLFLDEFNSAPLSVQAAAYRIVLDKEVGNHKLHKNVAIVCAGNKDSDKAIVNRMSTATQSRLVHFNLTVDSDDWLEWAEESRIDYRIRAFIGFRPEMLFNFNPNHSDNTFPTPRTYEFLSRLIKKFPNDVPAEKLPLMAGTIGEGAAIEFNSFIKIFEKLPSFEKILNNPTKTPVPEDDPSQLYAISSLIGEKVSLDTFEPVLKYIDRLPSEFQVITMKSIARIHPNVASNKNPAYNKWLMDNAKKFF